MNILKRYAPIVVQDDDDSFTVVLPNSHGDTLHVLRQLFHGMLMKGFTPIEISEVLNRGIEDYLNDSCEEGYDAD